MAGKRKVICTSTGCLDYAPERYKKYDIDIIRIRVNFQGKEYLEGYDLSPVEFYRELETMEDPRNNLPTTAMPTRESIMAAFDKAIDEGCEEAIVIALSAYLGGTYNLIRLIGEEYAGRLKVTVIDSKIACFGEGLLAIKAAELIEKDIPTETIVKEIHWMMERQEFIGVVGKLDYLVYNGRLKGGTALMGKMLSICPVIHFSHEGEICSMQSVRTQKKAINQMCAIIKDIIGDRSPEDYILWRMYAGTSMMDELAEIEEKHELKPNHEPMIISPVSGSHCGPWLAGYGLAFIRREDEPLE